uniref:Uncharacterized protein n=1 Tax=Anguilla anguilla TaxID=7936 RepID=A0A0E9VC44_ANGAN
MRHLHFVLRRHKILEERGGVKRRF